MSFGIRYYHVSKTSCLDAFVSFLEKIMFEYHLRFDLWISFKMSCVSFRYLNVMQHPVDNGVLFFFKTMSSFQLVYALQSYMFRLEFIVHV